MLVTLRYLAGRLAVDDLAKSPEILFFALMVGATAMGDLFEIAPTIGWNPTFGILGSFLLIGSMFSAILYGSLLFSLLYYDSIGSSANSFRFGLLLVSMILAAILLLVSTLTEILLGKIEPQ